MRRTSLNIILVFTNCAILYFSESRDEYRRYCQFNLKSFRTGEARYRNDLSLAATHDTASSSAISLSETEGTKVNVRVVRIVRHIQRTWKDLVRFRERIYAVIGESNLQNVRNDDVRYISEPRIIVGMRMNNGIGIR
jgi:hypothetical protein